MAKGLSVQRSIRMQPRLIAAAVAACFASAAVALPTAPNVVSGQATFNAQGKSLTITNTPGAIINWGGFSIRADELARFVQQSGSSSVLNRVVGQDPSQILGQLQSNGRVFLLNPNGIVFGAGAQIDVAGLVASTLHLSDADYLAGRMRFREQVGAGGIVNQGEIRTPSGGQVFLVAPRVENSGLITTPGGDIVLAAGKSVEIVDPANPSVRVEVSAPENEALNVGKLVASGGRITMAGSLLRVSGRVSADAAVVEDGKVVFRRTASPAATEVAGTVKLQAAQSLTVESGAAITADGPVAGKVELQSTGDLTLQLESKVSASGAVGGAVSAQATTGTLLSEGTVQVTGSDGPGGLIRLQGDRVALLNRSRTDASGADGGGIVLVGGGFQGSDAGTQNAKRTVVMPGAVVAADATREGDGGQVVVWSDEATRYYGAISARGAGEGKGGSVEVSGKQHLAFAGNVDVSARSGRSGSLLLDPLNITLSTAAGANIAGFTPPGDLQELFTDDAGLTSTFNVSAGGSFAGIAAGSNITLQATNNITVANNFNVATATGGNTNINVTLQANNTIAVNAVITTAGTGNITLIADNDQNGTGAITRTAAGTLNTGAGGTITLSAGAGVNAAVSSPTVTVSNANSGAVTVTNANAGGSVSFGNVVASSLSVTTSNGAVTQSGTMNVSAGTATFNLGTAGDVTLGNAANDFGTVAFTSARNVAVSDKNAIILGASTLAGNLSVTTANSAITQSGALVVPGTANFQAGTGNVTLATGTNNFNVVDVTAQVASVTDTNALTLGNVATSGNLTLSTGAGGLNQTASGTVTVGGTASFTAGATNNITLANATNNFTTLRVVSGNNVQLRDVDGFDFGGGASVVSGTLNMTAGGAVTQNSRLAVTGMATFNTGTADLTLGNTANAFSNVTIAAAGNATLYEAGGLGIAATAVANNLTVTSTGAITDTGNIIVAGALTLETRNNAARNITLDSPGNNFGSVSARTMNATGAAATAGTITIVENSAMQVQQLTTTGAANLVAAGAITQAGALSVGTTLTLRAASSDDITLSLATNNFGTVTVTQAHDVTLSDANAIVLGAMTLTGNLGVTTANGAITQSGALAIPGTANLQAGTGNITLATATNNFNVVEASGQAVSLRDANAMTLGNVSATGALTVVSVGALNQTAGGTVSAAGNATFNAGAGNDITLANATNNFTTLQVVSGNNVQLRDVNGFNFGVGTSAVSGNLTVTANGAVAQASALTVAGTASFDLAGNNLTLSNAGNNFSTLSVANGADVNLRDANALTLGNVSATGNLTVVTAGLLNQAAGSTVSAAGTTSLTAGAGNNITLANATNNFTTVRVVSGNNVQLRDVDGFDFGGGASVVSGTLNVTAGGAVTQNSSLAVTGLATFNTGTADLTLGNTANAFANVSILSAGNATLFEAGGFDLAATTVSNNLTVTSTGAITDSGNIVVPGRLTVETRNNTAQNITLDGIGNNFGSVSARTLNGAGAAAVAGTITLRENSAMDVALLTTTAAANLTAAGSITDSGALTVGGTLTANAGAGNDITLDTATNNFGTVAITAARNVTLVDANAMNVGAGTVSGNLVVTANGAVGFSGALSAGNLTLTTTNGAVTQSAALTVSGTANFQAGTGNVTLATGTNNFNVVDVTAQVASVTDTNALTLGNVATSGNLTLSTGAGGLNQTAGGTVTVGGTASFTAGAGNNITLSNATNNFNVVRVVSGNNVVLRDVDAMSFGGGASTVSGNLTVTTGGALTQASSLSVATAGRVATFNTGTADLTLGNTANAFGNVSILSAGNATLFEAGGFDLAATTVSNNLTVTSTGAITDSGNIVVAGRLTVETRNNTAQNITLDSIGNNFGSVSARTLNGAGAAAVAGTITLREASAMDLGRIETSGALNITALGAVTQAAGSNVVAGGTATFNAGTNALTLGNATNNFGTVAITQAGNATIVDQNAITLNATTVSGSLDVTATNNTLTVAGNISTAAANGAITFNAGTGTYVQNANVDVAAGSGNITVTANTLTVNTNTGNNALLTSGTLSLRPGAVGQAMTVAGTGGFDVTAAELNAILPGLNNAGGSLVLGRTDSTAALTIGAAHNFGVGSRVTLAAGSITDANTTNRTLTATDLTLYANSGNIGGAGNNAIDVAASNLVVGGNNQSAFVRSATGLNFGSSTSNLGSGSLVATAANGAITQSGAIVATGAATTFNAGTSTVTLANASNDFGTVQVTASSANLRDANGITLAAATLSGNLAVQANGAIAQSGALTVTGAATFNAGAGNVTLATATNNFGSLGLAGANANVATGGALSLRASTLTGNLTASANGAITQVGALNVGGTANFVANNNALTLTDSSNDFASVQVSSVGNTAIRDQNALAIAGANVNGTLSLTTAGDLTQTGAITATGTTTLNAGAGGNITLANTGNNFASVLVPSANNVSLYDASAIDLGAFSVNGAITVQGVGNVSLSGVLTAAGSGNAIVLAAGGNFVNNAGASALSAANGRWLVYSTDPAANTFGGLASGNNPLWSKTYAANPPSSISLAGNRYLFSAGRTLTVTGTDVSKTYGDDLIGQMAQSYTVTGLNSNTFGGAFLADTQSAVLAGAPDIASTGAAASAAVAGSPYAMTLGAGTLSSTTGYAISYGAAGQLTVTRAPLTIGVQDALRLEGQPNPAFSATYSGFRNGEAAPVLLGALQFATPAGPNSVPGSYSVTPSGYSAANYTITYVPGTLRILSPIGGDPLRDSYVARRGLADQGQLEFRGAGRASIPTFIVAEADLPFEELVRRMPATAAGPDGNRPRRLRDPNCGTGLPLASLRCRTVDDD